MNLQQRKLLVLFAILGLACIMVNGRQIAARAMILERRQDSTPGDQVTEFITQFDTVVSPGSTKAPVIVTRVSTSQATTSRTSYFTTTTSVSLSPTPTTSSTALYCNAGYTLCGTELGGGCCKTGYTCALTGCIPPTGTITPSPSRTCAIASQTLCNSSMNFGCCAVGQECGFSSCTQAGGPAVTKVLDVDANNLKLSATATTSTPPSTTPTQQGDKNDSTPLSKIAIGGIVGGAVVAIIALAFAWVFTRRHIKKRSNTDASRGVLTTNVFDPTATFSGQHGSNSSRYRGSHPPATGTDTAAKTKIPGTTKMSEYHPHHPIKGPAVVPPAHSPPLQHSPPAGDQRFDFGPGVGGGHVYQPVPLSEQMPVELGASPVEGWRMEGNEVYEVEGDGGGRSPGTKRKSWGWTRNSGSG